MKISQGSDPLFTGNSCGTKWSERAKNMRGTKRLLSCPTPEWNVSSLQQMNNWGLRDERGIWMQWGKEQVESKECCVCRRFSWEAHLFRSCRIKEAGKWRGDWECWRLLDFQHGRSLHSLLEERIIRKRKADSNWWSKDLLLGRQTHQNGWTQNGFKPWK